MSPEPGWYHAQGDPPGTVRRWNGTAWIGFPIEAPSADGETTASNQGVGVTRFSPVPGQASLKVVAILTQIALLPIAGALIFQGIAALRAAGGNRVEVAQAIGDDSASDSAYELATAIFALFGLLGGIIFIVWFTLAYRNISLWSKQRRAVPWAVFAWLVPFINLVRPMSMMLELAERSPRDDRKGAISPVPVIVWWLLWMLPGIAVTFGIIAVVRDTLATGLNSGAGSTVLVMVGIASLINAVSALIAIYLVQVITDHQDRRMHPTPAQRALMQREAEAAAFQQDGPNQVY